MGQSHKGQTLIYYNNIFHTCISQRERVKPIPFYNEANVHVVIGQNRAQGLEEERAEMGLGKGQPY
jgi:hypothetical protein